MKRISRFLGVAYIVFMVALAWKDVGAQVCENPYVYEWDIVLIVGAIVIVPFVLGYLSGRQAG